MAEIRIDGEEFLNTLRIAVSYKLREERGSHQFISPKDVAREMDDLAKWLVHTYFKETYALSSDKD